MFHHLRRDGIEVVVEGLGLVLDCHVAGEHRPWQLQGESNQCCQVQYLKTDRLWRFCRGRFVLGECIGA